MQVTFQLADAEEPRLRKIATRCGYESLERFVSDYVSQLTRQHGDEDLAPMSEEQMQASLKMIDQSMKEIDEGQYYTLEEARRLSLDRLREQQR